MASSSSAARAAAPPKFVPPSAEQVSTWLEQQSLQPPHAWLVWVPWGVMGAAILIMLLLQGPLSLVLPWLALAGLLIWAMWRARSVVQQAGSVERMQELVLLRRYESALRQIWRMLPQVRADPLARSRLLHMMSNCLDHLGQYDAAMVVHDELLEQLPSDHPAVAELRVRRAIAALEAERLADADDALRQVRPKMQDIAGTPLAAGITFAQLLQFVRTHHFADALSMAPTLVEKLRPLGVDAGYGHALMALCHHAAPDTQPEQARQWWRRATTLLPDDVLTRRFPELVAVREQRDD